MNFNKAIIIGNLTRDPEAKVVPETGLAISNFGVATNRAWTDAQGQKQDQVEFHNVVAFGRLAEICNQYLRKGSLVCIEGRLQTRNWVGQDGLKRYRTEIVANNMQMGPRTQGMGRPSQLAGEEERLSQTVQPQASEPTIELTPEPASEATQESSSEETGEEVNLKKVPF